MFRTLDQFRLWQREEGEGGGRDECIKLSEKNSKVVKVFRSIDKIIVIKEHDDKNSPKRRITVLLEVMS